MSRHNRRRTRGGQKAFNIPHNNFDIPSFPTTEAPPKLLAPRHLRRNEISAKHWQNRYLAWQARERKQKEERDRLIEEQQRIFGGDSEDGDDEGLCGRMMDYFVRLDYLEG